MPVARIVRPCIASSSRSPSLYGQSSMEVFWPGICSGRRTEMNSTYLASAVGSTALISADKLKPTHGITIDHASTQRRR